MMYKELPDEYSTCPYNPSHQVQRLRIQSHILKCRKNYPDTQLVSCHYNVRHLVKAEDMPKHLETCGDKIRLEGSRYRDHSTTASTLTSLIDDDEDDKSESVISFGMDFKNCLPSSNSSIVSSTLSSRLSSRGGNLLLKMGPRGNLSRYATGQRKTELEERELKYLESYDGFSSHQATSSPKSTPEKKNEAMDDSSDEDLKPLPLPKTSSKAFTSHKRSLFEDSSKNKVPKDKNTGIDKKHKPENLMKSKYLMEYEKEYGEEADVEYPSRSEEKSEAKLLPLKQTKSSISSSGGRGYLVKNFNTESERKPGKKKLSSLLPDVSDIDDEVPKRKTESKLFLKNKNDYDTIISGLGCYGRKKPESFLDYRDNYGEDSSDTDTTMSAASSVIYKASKKNNKSKENEDNDSEEETCVMNTSLGRGFLLQKKKEKPVRSMGRGFVFQ